MIKFIQLSSGIYRDSPPTHPINSYALLYKIIIVIVIIIIIIIKHFFLFLDFSLASPLTDATSSIEAIYITHLH